ncbi:hypothetical protein MM326_18735 [Alkalihalobacillus sp. LMS6]|uniref:hypothetical protein n=1 Tax=Alkalihalobacillus sp. LMS6 TaxID=2924034 RepID=UPI0020CFF53E|nr:hypothetical protein [Alkalihalobacillus sp. LMS6]UTR06090.1 hypothetical protein MM326_18735 [Alkalihalobacillus sp. LMS6]
MRYFRGAMNHGAKSIVPVKSKINHSATSIGYDKDRIKDKIGRNFLDSLINEIVARVTPIAVRTKTM